MRMIIVRLIAVMLLVIPGFMATYGFLIMKDAIFNSFGPAHFSWGFFFIGFLLFGLGIAFIGGWIFFRDRKRNYVAPKFMPKKIRKPRL